MIRLEILTSNQNRKTCNIPLYITYTKNPKKKKRRPKKVSCNIDTLSGHDDTHHCQTRKSNYTS